MGDTSVWSPSLLLLWGPEGTKVTHWGNLGHPRSKLPPKSLKKKKVVVLPQSHHDFMEEMERCDWSTYRVLYGTQSGHDSHPSGVEEVQCPSERTTLPSPWWLLAHWSVLSLLNTSIASHIIPGSRWMQYSACFPPSNVISAFFINKESHRLEKLIC